MIHCQKLNIKFKIDNEKFNILYNKLGTPKKISNQIDFFYKIPKSILKIRHYEKNNIKKLFLHNDDKMKICTITNPEEILIKNILEKDIKIDRTRLHYYYKLTKIHLDYIKYLGYFVELENDIRSKKEIKNVKNYLNLEGKYFENLTYDKIFKILN
jgi:adenylate cyclase class IV